jgi:hypothetical protein
VTYCLGGHGNLGEIDVFWLQTAAFHPRQSALIWHNILATHEDSYVYLYIVSSAVYKSRQMTGNKEREKTNPPPSSSMNTGKCR